MTYDFAMDKKAVLSLLAGGVVMGVLLFAAGWIVGAHWTSSGSASAATMAGRKPGAGDNELAALPKEPVLKDDADQAVAVAAAAPGKAAATAGPEIAPPAGIPAAQPPRSAVPGSIPPDDSATTAAVDGQEDIIQTADSEPAAAAASTGSEDASVKSVFTVQVGVFLDAKEASRLLSTMERHGYAPSFFADRDAENRQWYAVRIGAYTDKDQAAKAAANFTKQESIKAVVRPLGSL